MIILPLPCQFEYPFISCLTAVAGIPIWSWREIVRVDIFVWFQILVWRLSAFHCWILYCCGFVINSFYVELCSLYINLCKGFFKKSCMDVEFYQMLFLRLLRSSYSFCPFSCWCNVSHWLICICWAILMTLGWIQLGRGVWPFVCVVRFSLLIFCWEFLHLYSSKVLTCNFLFLVVCLCLVLVLGWQWLHKTSLGVFLPLWFFWKSLRRICVSSLSI